MNKRLELQNKVSMLTTILRLLKLKREVNTLYQSALSFLGRDASPSDHAPDMVGCADSVSAVIQKVLPDFPTITGTYTLYSKLSADPRFRRVSIPMPGAIIISPTGLGDTERLANGHVGIMGMGDTIMSNNSYGGLWEQNYTIASWKARYGAAGYPMLYFTLIK